MSNKVHEVMTELSEAHYLGDIKSIAVVTINKDNEPELRLSISPGHAYAINAAYDLLKRHLVDKLIGDGSSDIKGMDG